MEITKDQENQIDTLAKDHNLDTDLTYIIKESDAEDIDELSDYIDEQTNGFQAEIIYYNRAMEYLLENDPSLQYSIGIAVDMGFELKNLNSELLASLLASQNEREAYDGIRDELNEILFPDNLERTDEEIEEDNKI